MGHRAELPSSDLLHIPDGHLFTKLPKVWGAIGLACLAGSWFAAGGDSHVFAPSFLVAFLFGLSLALGALFFTMIQFAARAGWSVTVRRTAESLMAPLPFFAVLFLGVYVFRDFLFSHWIGVTAETTDDKILIRKLPYLNEGFWTVRAIIYFALWSGFSFVFRKLSVKQDAEGGEAITGRLQLLSYPGIIAFGITATFAAIDWNMSINPHFYSTMWGVQFFAGCFVSAVCMIALIHLALHRTGLIGSAVNQEHYHDLGKLIFAFTVFWAYVSFSQYFLIWYANIPEETLFYSTRSETWGVLGAMLMAGHFGAPFLFMMPRTVKKTPWALMVGCLWMIVFHYLDLYYNVMPNFSPDSVHFSAVDILSVLGVFGIYFAIVTTVMRKAALVPLKDPRLSESLNFQNI